MCAGVLQPPLLLSPNQHPDVAISSTLLETTLPKEQPQPHCYFHSFLMDMFFSLSFCITWVKRRRQFVPSMEKALQSPSPPRL